MTKSFYSWLLQFESDATPLGDLARDAKEDKHFPHYATTQKYLKNYLERKGACEDALSTFEEAFIRYSNE